MKQKPRRYFKNVRALGLFIEAGGAVVHRLRRDAYYSLRELPSYTELILPYLIPYTEAEMARDHQREEKIRNERKSEPLSELKMKKLFDPEY